MIEKNTKKRIGSRKTKKKTEIKKKPVRLKILFICSELEGLVKTGGLGDITKSLAKELLLKGHDVRVVLPYYSEIFQLPNKRIIESLNVKPGTNKVGCAILESKYDSIPIYLIENHNYFARARLYDDGFNEYNDNAERFSCLSASALQVAEKIGFHADIIHCHDWQTSLATLYLKRLATNNKKFKKTKSVLTIHNGLFQGKYSAFYRGFLGLENSFNDEEFKEFNYINILKGGIYFADMVNTVSPGYAAELLTKEGGHGLHEYYIKKGNSFCGILNGCDTSIWNPKKDKYIAANYSINSLENKFICKKDLINKFGLKVSPKQPLIGIVSRLTDQKGFHYTIPSLIGLLRLNIAVVVLGSGDIKHVNGMNYLKNIYKDNFGWYHGYSDEIAHKIEAGSDLFLMASIFEPCGLNQMYSHIYGTLPIVRSVGGLKDTVINCEPNKNNKSNGFVFNLAYAEAVYNTVTWALGIFKNNKLYFDKMVNNAMKIDYSWKSAVKKYENMYIKLIKTNNKNE